MEALKILLTTDTGLMSLAVIAFVIVMGLYLRAHLRRLMNAEPGKEGWN
jgi:hypothetical protein